MKPRATILFVAGETRHGHGGDLAAVEFLQLMRSTARVVRLDPDPAMGLLAAPAHALAIRTARRRLKRGGRTPTVCINHPRFLLSTLLARPMLLYHGFIGLRLAVAAGGAARRALSEALLWTVTSALLLVCRHIFAIGNAMTDFPPPLRESDRLLRVSNPMLQGAEAKGVSPVSARDRLIYVGRMVELKGVRELLRLFQQAGLGTRLLMIGNGPLAADVAAASNWGVIHLPSCTPGEIAQFFREGLGFISHSPNETFCRPVFEAAAAGRPSFVPEWDGNADWLAGLAFVKPAPRTPEALQQLVETLSGRRADPRLAAAAERFLQDERSRFLAAMQEITDQD